MPLYLTIHLLNNKLIIYREFEKKKNVSANFSQCLNYPRHRGEKTILPFSETVLVCSVSNQGPFTSEILSTSQMQGGQLLWRSY